MFQVIDACGCVHDAYGAFVDKDGDVQFILCDISGRFYRTDHVEGFYRLYTEDIKAEFYILLNEKKQIKLYEERL